MKSDQEYIEELENIISTIMPYYVAYFGLIGKELPKLEVPHHIKRKKLLPALLSGDFRRLPQTGEKTKKKPNDLS
jgi:hypothetical protein